MPINKRRDITEIRLDMEAKTALVTWRTKVEEDGTEIADRTVRKEYGNPDAAQLATDTSGPMANKIGNLLDWV